MRTLAPILLVACTATPPLDGADDTDPADTDAVDTDTSGPILPLTSCTAGDACEAPAAAEARATSRADFFFPYGPGILGTDPEDVFGTDAAPAYPEASIADPVGRRVHVVGVAAVSGALLAGTPIDPSKVDNERYAAFQVRLDGVDIGARIDDGSLTWARVWPPTFEAGDPLWVSFHTLDTTWDLTDLQVVVPSTGGDALDVTVSAEPAPVPLTSVEASADGSTLWVALRNESTAPHTLDRLVVDGADLTDAACIPDPVLAPGATLLIEVPLCSPAVAGAAWTVAATFTDAPPSVAGGRHLLPLFPIEAWPASGDCPFPGVNDANFQRHLDAGIDTFFAYRSYGGREGCTDVAIESIVPALRAADAWLFPADDGGWNLAAEDLDRVPARLLGDESDNKSLADLLERQEMRKKAEEATWWALREPSVASYVGGSRHRHNGMFAGSTDIQSMDYYVAACAPHITDFGAHPPLRGAYDYLVATWRNHRPLTTWTYAQGLSGAWTQNPAPVETRIQAMSVAAAGNKGILWFQSNLERADAAPATWAEIGRTNRELRAVRDLLRLGAPTGSARVIGGRAIVEAIRAPGALVVVVIGLDAATGPTELDCIAQNQIPWSLTPTDVTVEVDVPDDLGVADAFEVVDGAIVPLPGEAGRRGRTWVLPSVTLDDAHATRLFVLGTDAAARATVTAAR